MNYETIKIEKVEKACPACEEYAEKHSTNSPRIAVMSCEGACAKGEVARMAANLITHQLARENTVRICLGGAFTKDTGQRNLVRMANKTIAVEGCFISCSSRMMKGVLPDLCPVIVQADTLYESSLPFGIDEVPEEELRECARVVAANIVAEHIKKPAATGKTITKKEPTAKNTKSSCCGN